MAKRIPRPGFTFPGVVPQEALQYFRAKGLKVGFSYQDVFREEHAYSFTVAKVMELDLLQDIQAALDKALAAGQTLATFQKNLKPTLTEKGWWGVKEMADPASGEVKAVQLGSPRRLKTIYDVNLRTARSAGQWQRIERTMDSLPYLRYSLGPSEHHRQEHAAWDGTILPATDPWFDTHFTSNGYGCKCRIRQVGRYEMQKNKWRVSDRPADGTREWINKRTGEVTEVPIGIDPGFDYNPGKERRQNMDKYVAGKLKAADPQLAAAARKDLEAYGQM